jgi:hypothetical protein
VLLSEAGRARALYELAISQPVLDMPEALWKAYIDFEIAQVRPHQTRCNAATVLPSCVGWYFPYACCHLLLCCIKQQYTHTLRSRLIYACAGQPRPHTAAVRAAA